MILMEREAIFPTDVETSKDFALILYAAKQTMLNAERIRTPTATRLIMMYPLSTAKLQSPVVAR